MLKNGVFPQYKQNIITKSLILSTIVIFSIISLQAESKDIIQIGLQKYRPIKNANLHKIKPPDYSKINYAAPEWEWIKEPYSIMTSSIDYMPSGHGCYPLRLQHNGDGGMYYTWHAIPYDNPTANIAQYWAFINKANGNLVDWGTITAENISHGHGSINTHPKFGGGIASWTQDNASLGYGTTITYDSYIFSTPGFWVPYQFIPPEEPGGNEYLWPKLWVGPAADSSKIRVYQTAKNYNENPYGNPCEDIRIMYCDVENTYVPDMNVLLDLSNWTEITPMFYWREKDCRPQSICFTVDPNYPGHVSIIGYASWLSDDLGNMPVNPGMFVWDSYDYGETWNQANLHSSPTQDKNFYYVENTPAFEVNGTVFDSLGVTIGGFNNTARYDSDGNLHMCYLQMYCLDPDSKDYYLNNFMPAAEVVWDGVEFIYDEVPEMPGEDPLSGHTVPWEIDPASGDTLTYPVVVWSTYENNFYAENIMNNAVDIENGSMIQMWADGTYIRLNELGIPGYEDYAEHPIIYLSASWDNGENWSEPVEVTDIYSTEVGFMEQISVYPYLCNEIEDLGDGWGKVHFSYMDDNSFGSSFKRAERNNGGQIMYGSFKYRPNPNFPPNADFNADITNGEPPLTVNFTDLSTSTTSPIGEWYWQFGDGSDTVYTSYIDTITHTYQDSGFYTVGLTVTDAEGLSDTEIKENYMHVGYDAAEEDIPSLQETVFIFPNPVTSSTNKVNIKFSIPKSSKVKIQIFNIKGQLVSTVLNQPLNSGEHIISHSIEDLFVGIYFIMLNIGDNKQEIRKMVKIK
ncbi:MAG: T9SS type A sorting domain-containing protein [Candidatus Cloacimonetes bacterium]|nr:T9SS type A sorting domain-containing protein [Candidatus Cloacimonadota bacterium]